MGQEEVEIVGLLILALVVVGVLGGLGWMKLEFTGHSVKDVACVGENCDEFENLTVLDYRGEGCESAWVCSVWSRCEEFGDVQKRTCVDVNRCVVATDVPIVGRICGEPVEGEPLLSPPVENKKGIPWGEYLLIFTELGIVCALGFVIYWVWRKYKR